MTTFDPDIWGFQPIVRKLDPAATLLRALDLKGGVSAQVTALDIMRGNGEHQKVVVRQYGATDLKNNAHIAAHEFQLLQVLQRAGIAAPTPYFFDVSGTILPTPYLVIEYVEGETTSNPADLNPFLLQSATHLAAIHAITGTHPDVAFLPPIETFYRSKLNTRSPLLDEGLSEGEIRAVLDPIFPLPSRNPAVLLHGDYWGGNLLWRDGELVAIIDWEDAAVGDPLADLANSRLEMLWAFGREAMHTFTDHYRAHTSFDFSHLPYWDLCAALRPAGKLTTWGLPDDTVAAMRASHRWFVEQALAKISGES